MEMIFLEKEEQCNSLTKLINILVVVLLVSAILFMIVEPHGSKVPMLLALLGFTISSIPGIFKKKVSGWIFGGLGLILIILLFI